MIKEKSKVAFPVTDNSEYFNGNNCDNMTEAITESYTAEEEFWKSRDADLSGVGGSTASHYYGYHWKNIPSTGASVAFVANGAFRFN